MKAAFVTSFFKNVRIATSGQSLGKCSVRYSYFVAPTAKSAKRNATAVKCQSELYLSEENVDLVLVEAKETLQTMFGNTEENRKVGITGDIELVEIDGISIVLRMTGRFWHKKSDVLARVSLYLQGRIPEIADVVIEDPAQLDDADEKALIWKYKRRKLIPHGGSFIRREKLGREHSQVTPSTTPKRRNSKIHSSTAMSQLSKLAFNAPLRPAKSPLSSIPETYLK